MYATEVEMESLLRRHYSLRLVASTSDPRILTRFYRTSSSSTSIHTTTSAPAPVTSEPPTLPSTMPETRSKENLVWIDCEMTGLDIEKDTIMSLACFITDYQLNLLDPTGYEAIIHHSPAQLSAMGEWCTSHHGSSGLTQQCLTSNTTAATAASELLAYIQKFCPERKRALLAGNTVHADKLFLSQEPWRQVVKWLHHRIYDVSAIKEAARRFADVEVLKTSPMKKGLHEAKADILESIEEAKWQRDVFFKGKEMGGT